MDSLSLLGFFDSTLLPIWNVVTSGNSDQLPTVGTDTEDGGEAVGGADGSDDEDKFRDCPITESLNLFERVEKVKW